MISRNRTEEFVREAEHYIFYICNFSFVILH